ncbi:uncharacterized protein LOC122055787 isoform X1 [Zingiber officinale]|uniref:Uncharacterized protein n=1 Tax=Zingiber officinale TaxID=94328 RepID=A0A8J5H0M3_ZINOF|nr:uncharacterized protein LOC122055787 isoform X1 [Zingiber officinale]KAG6517374.1 hypothetical protein ZIOFF_020759 [Zingiber officinale]
MAAKSSQLWYETTPSTYTEDDDRSRIRMAFKIPHDHRIRIPRSDQRPHVPPDGFTTFFHEQLVGGLRFPVPSFFTEVSEYFRIPLQQLTPNSFKLLCAVVIIFRFHHLPLNPVTFHYFFYAKTIKVGVFYFTARLSSKFLKQDPKSHKSWKSWKTRYFFVKPACPFTWPIGWQRELPPQPYLGNFKDDDTYQAAADVLIDLHFDGNLLLEESLLFYYGLSPIETQLKQPLADIMLRASCNKHMKWSRARLSAPEDSPATDPSTSAKLAPPRPSMSPKVVSSGESEEQFQFEFQPRKRSRDLKQSAEASSSRQSASPSLTPPSPVTPQPTTPRESAPPTSPSSSTIPGISSGDDVPRRRRSPPLVNSLWEQIMATEEEAAKNKSLPALCDSMVETNIKLLAEQRELTTRGPYLMERYRAMKAMADECQAQLENKNKELEASKAETAQLKTEAAAHTEQIARLLAKLQESKQRRLASELREAEERGRRERLAAEVENLKEQRSNYKVGEETQWASKKKAFLSSVEFYDILGARTVLMLKYGFEGAIRQVQKVGHLPKGTSLDFLDLQKVLDSIPDDLLAD